jgi:hypothetical protein
MHRVKAQPVMELAHKKVSVLHVDGGGTAV